MAAARRVKTILGSTSFQLDNGIVWVYTNTAKVGGWKVERYGDKVTLNIAWIREWAAENLTDPTVN